LKDTFFHHACAQAVCEDCRIMSEEYAQLLEIRTERLYWLEQQHELMVHQVEQLKKEVKSWEEIATLGYSEIIQRFLRSESDKAMRAGREAERRRWAKFEADLKAMQAEIKRTKGRVDPCQKSKTATRSK
jgi:predicted aminopeptidase